MNKVRKTVQVAVQVDATPSEDGSFAIECSDKTNQPSTATETIDATLVNDQASMDIAFLSMQQLLSDPAAKTTAASSTGAALEPSIVSGTTDLFEGDLGDDELPSILSANGGDNLYENLQLNAVDLVEEVQEEVQQQADADPEDPTSLAAAIVVDGAGLPSPSKLISSSSKAEHHNKTLEQQKPLVTTSAPLTTKPRRPVVPFVKVRKLSDAEAVAKKRPAMAPPAAAAPLIKKARSVEASAKEEDPNKPTPRMTRSRMRKAGQEATIATGLAARTRTNRKESPVKVISSPVKVQPPTKKSTAPTSATTTTIQHAHRNPTEVAASADKSTSQDQASKESKEPLLPISNEASHSDSGSVTGSVSSATEIVKEATETAMAAAANSASISIVTPVGSEEAVSAKQVVMASKVESASISLPSLPRSSGATTKVKLTSTLVPCDDSAADALPAAVVKEACSTGSQAAATVVKERSCTTGSQAAADKKIQPRRSSSKAKSNGKSSPPHLPEVTVDTSTAHIQALTGENGASVCLSARKCTLLIPNQSDNDTPAPVKPTSSPPVPLTEEERVQQSRDRNRKHARNTRLRKKAYVEELKQTLNELVTQRDTSAAVEEQNRRRELEQREVRFMVMKEFLKLRGSNETDKKRWSAILVPPFSITMPKTTFQEMVSTTDSTGTALQQKLVGVDQVMQDSCHFAAFLQSLDKSNIPGNDGAVKDTSSKSISLVYHCDRQDFLMDGCKAVVGWNATTVGAVDKGAKAELSFHGNFRAHFCPESNRLRSTELIFDTGTVMNQLDALKG
ncbi:expressed unknown protein [Seminavis robusta]|uniref:BZIP domain-containing protein n=1 Tax=Seminavis robusta TaxID=568900 RepID=A0A9N8ESW7_9STRA|nr:expressed unknown protein [Seminavis robusta]|eukprot:Sro1864_g302380.1 n/a (794) ;mRNA; r:3150-5746